MSGTGTGSSASNVQSKPTSVLYEGTGVPNPFLGGSKYLVDEYGNQITDEAGNPILVTK